MMCITYGKKIFSFLYYWLPPLLLTMAIIAFAGDLGSVHNFQLTIYFIKFLFPELPQAEVYHFSVILRKIGHFVAYALLCLSYTRAFYRQVRLSRTVALLLALSVCLVVAVADEGRQFFYTSRSGRPQDVLLDMSGAATAGVLWLLTTGTKTLLGLRP